MMYININDPAVQVIPEKEATYFRTEAFKCIDQKVNIHTAEHGACHVAVFWGKYQNSENRSALFDPYYVKQFILMADLIL